MIVSFIFPIIVQVPFEKIEHQRISLLNWESSSRNAIWERLAEGLNFFKLEFVDCFRFTASACERKSISRWRRRGYKRERESILNQKKLVNCECNDFFLSIPKPFPEDESSPPSTLLRLSIPSFPFPHFSASLIHSLETLPSHFVSVRSVWICRIQDVLWRDCPLIYRSRRGLYHWWWWWAARCIG